MLSKTEDKGRQRKRKEDKGRQAEVEQICWELHHLPLLATSLKNCLLDLSVSDKTSDPSNCEA